MSGERERPLSRRDWLVAACIALVLVAIVAAIFRLGIAVLHG